MPLTPFDVAGLTGTDAEAAAALAATRLTRRDLPVRGLYLALIDWGVLVEDLQTRVRSGKLVEVAGTHPDPAARAALRRLLTALSPDSARVVATATDATEAALVGSLADQLLTPAQRLALADLTGGERYAGVTAADVAAARAAAAANAARASLAARVNGAVGALTGAFEAGKDAAGCRAAFDAAWGAP